MTDLSLVVVTATTNPERSVSCVETWLTAGTQLVTVYNGLARSALASAVSGNQTMLGQQGYLGSVAAFRIGVDYALEHSSADIIACLHDDLEIHDPAWVQKVCRHFARVPACGLLGFGGAIGLGDADLYQKPYEAVQLARTGFRSNLVDAEVHGMRSLLTERVACLDGFSQIGRRAFWEGYAKGEQDGWQTVADELQSVGVNTLHVVKEATARPWHLLESLGIVHHLYDSLLGAIAARYGWETWYLPIRCRHLGGQTAVADQGYQQWAQSRTEGGDHGFWEQAHAAGYEAFRDVLPLRV